MYLWHYKKWPLYFIRCELQFKKLDGQKRRKSILKMCSECGKIYEICELYTQIVCIPSKGAILSRGKLFERIFLTNSNFCASFRATQLDVYVQVISRIYAVQRNKLEKFRLSIAKNG